MTSFFWFFFNLLIANNRASQSQRICKLCLWTICRLLLRCYTRWVAFRFITSSDRGRWLFLFMLCIYTNAQLGFEARADDDDNQQFWMGNESSRPATCHWWNYDYLCDVMSHGCAVFVRSYIYIDKLEVWCRREKKKFICEFNWLFAKRKTFSI